MQPKDAIRYIVDDTLLITPGDRSDLIHTALESLRETDKDKLKVSGIILSGGLLPDASTIDLLKKAQIPVLLSRDDTYAVATTIHDITVKMRPQDTLKISTAVKLIKDNVDLNTILKGM
jgi:BioD-like phosphotransacetylase family protein